MGLQTPLLSQTRGFKSVLGNDGLSKQVHHCNNHWVVSGSLNGVVFLCDSYSKKKVISGDLAIQLAQVYETTNSNKKKLTVHLKNVQQQEGEVDCGLYTIAFAFHIAGGNAVGKLSLQQDKMKEHLINCFEKGQMKAFPKMSQGTEV